MKLFVIATTYKEGGVQDHLFTLSELNCDGQGYSLGAQKS